MYDNHSHSEKKEPVLWRSEDGHLFMSGFGTVRLQIDYEHVLGRGGQGIVFGGNIFKNCSTAAGESLVMKVWVCMYEG